MSLTNSGSGSLSSSPPSGLSQRFLNGVEWAGNKLPDPAFLFVIALFITWAASSYLSTIGFSEIDPRTKEPIQIVSQLTATSLVNFLANMVKTFIEFPPLGLVLVALLGVGVAEHTGFVQATLKGMLRLTPRWLLTPMLLLVAILSHSAGDSGYVLIIPLGAVIFQAAGRHPLLGITTACAGVSGGFSANFLPASLDPLLQGFTQKAAQILDPTIVVNPLCNWGFMTGSCVVIVCVGWYVTDCVIAPRVLHLPVDGESTDASHMDHMSRHEVWGLLSGMAVLALCLATLVLVAWPKDSPFRSADGDLVGRDSPLMKSIVPLIFLLFLLPGIAHGYVAGKIKNHRDIVEAMTKSMGTISYYLVMAFFAAQFTSAFAQSNVGVLLAVKGANCLAGWKLPSQVTIVGIIFLTAAVNLLIGSASAKWALLSPIFVPMLMSLGLSPELTQAAYRVGDSSTNIITPLLPFFPLVVVYGQRYVKSTGIGTLVSLMLPYSMGFLVAWSVLLLVYWNLGIPLGLQAGYTYSP